MHQLASIEQLIKALVSNLETDDIQKIAKTMGLSAQTLIEGTLSPVRIAQLVRLMREVTRDEAVGLLKSSLDPGTVEFFCRSTISARNCREAFYLGGKYLRLVTKDLRLTLSEGKATSEVFFEVNAKSKKSEAIFTFLMLIAFQRWLTWLTGQKFIFKKISVYSGFENLFKLFEEAFDCEVVAGDHGSYVQFSTQLLERSSIRVTNSLNNMLSRFSDDVISHLGLENSITSRVSRLISQGSSFRDLSIESAAQHLFMSKDSLKRKLGHEGNSFGNIKRQCRLEIATYLLSCTDSPIGTISYQLGFSEPSAFIRAFKIWTGESPGMYRRRYSKH